MSRKQRDKRGAQGLAIQVSPHRTVELSPEQDRKAQRKAERRWRRRKRLPWTLAFLFFFMLDIAAAVGLYSYIFLSNNNAQLRLEDEEAVLEVLEPTIDPAEPFYALILGIDTRGNTKGSRSDTIILARVDTVNQQVILMSMPRDTKITIDGHGYQKVNAAYAFGGSALAVEKMSELCEVPISHVVVINFDGVEDLVDALGGVTVDVPPNTMVDNVWVPSGVQTINGEQALIFARCRLQYARGDLQRADNQRALVAAVAEKILELPVTQMPDVITTCCSFVSTDMSVQEIIELAMHMRGMDPDNIISCVAPVYSSYENGISYQRLYWDDFEAMMDSIRAGENPNE
ncbi:MAG: LCP family protein [Coriobacteriales bacterium]|nr:LCP family protein [Coriobacteriales bacterium]